MLLGYILFAYIERQREREREREGRADKQTPSNCRTEEVIL